VEPERYTSPAAEVNHECIQPGGERVSVYLCHWNSPLYWIA
jgi:hypothetical protein